MRSIIGLRSWTYWVSGVSALVSVGALLQFGLVPGLDFTGGTLMEVGCNASSTTCALSADALRPTVHATGVRSLSVQDTDQRTVLIRYVASDEEQNTAVRTAIQKSISDVQFLREEFIGASVSGHLRNNALTASIVAVCVITMYVAWAFRAVSFSISSWIYGVSAIIALLHDLLLVAGVFAFLGRLYGVEVGVPFIAALLTILGYSVNDTIVVYDRVRENLLRHGSKKSFEEIVDQSVHETLARSINTSVTVIVTLIAIMIFGGAALFYFALALLIGITAGTYSSIFVASALLVTIQRILKQRRNV